MSSADLAVIAQTFAIMAVPILFGITLHEVAHGRMARRLGDRTAERLGRLSLNPLRHIDPVGTVLVPAFLYITVGFMFGWARPVPINPQGLRDPKRDMVAVALAGPCANFAMAIGWALVYRLLVVLVDDMNFVTASLIYMARIGFFFNILLGVFNLLPVPPLDGGRVLRGLVSDTLAARLDALERFGLIIVIGLIFLGLLGPIVLFANFLMKVFGLPPFVF